jgi:hypothetical protein
MSGAHSQFTLLKTQRFLPLFITQAIGAFNDNAFRFALSIVLVYDLGPRLGFDAGLTNTISAGLLTLPFFLFSALAGQLADKFDKAALTRRIKFIEILIVALASASLFTDNVWLQLACVFLTGTQSAFFGPIKYSILPQHLDRHELLGGNGLIEMGTFISVLLGTLFGSFFILHGAGRESVSAAISLSIPISSARPSASWARPVSAAMSSSPFSAFPGSGSSVLSSSRKFRSSPVPTSTARTRWQASSLLSSRLASALGLSSATGCWVAKSR